jgi:5'-3' exonuclease
MSKTLDLTQFVMNDEFVARFSNLFEKCLLHLLKIYFNIKRKNFTNVTVIFAKDCPRCDIWRMDIYPQYKASRYVHKPNDLFDSKIFDHVYKIILPYLMDKYSFVKCCSSHQAEADDVIAIISYYLQDENELFNTEKTIIITNDNDYLQLLDVVDGIYNLQGKDLSYKSLEGCAKKNMLLKVLIGDPSDNIKGIFPKTRTNSLLSNHNNIEDIEKEWYTIASTKQLEAYNLNKTLICFSNIPTPISEDIKQDFYNQTILSSVI